MKANFNDIIAGPEPVLIDFWAEWCGPCRAMAPILKEVKNEIGDAARILKLDVDKHPAISEQLGIRSIPTLVFYKNGKEIWRQSGVVSAGVLAKKVLESA